MMKAMDQFYSTNETIKARLVDKNIVYLNSYSLPPNLFACNGDIVSSVADVEGVKISRTGSSSDIFKELGGIWSPCPSMTSIRAWKPVWSIAP